MLVSGALVTSVLFSSAAMATEKSEKEKIYQDLAQMCEYYPNECAQTILGMGNGGGNEPPYTPRKPKKEK